MGKPMKEINFEPGLNPSPNDLVDMYLREMRGIELQGREEEVGVAKRTEAGDGAVAQSTA